MKVFSKERDRGILLKFFLIYNSFLFKFYDCTVVVLRIVLFGVEGDQLVSHPVSLVALPADGRWFSK